MSVVDQVRAPIACAFESMEREGLVSAGALEGTAWVVERPKRPEHGDLATNVAMAVAGRSGRPPRALAEALVSALGGGDVVASASVAGPGFVNLRLHPRTLHQQVMEVLRAGTGWGRAPAATGERVNIVFATANPTTPLTHASAPNAILPALPARLP